MLDRTIAIRFDANVAPGLNWSSRRRAPEVSVKLGETTTVFYKVKNDGTTPTTGIATFNVQPALAGAYFIKLECFCFTEQTLQPGETMEFAVVFYVDPGAADGPERAGPELHHAVLHLLPRKGRETGRRGREAILCGARTRRRSPRAEPKPRP